MNRLFLAALISAVLVVPGAASTSDEEAAARKSALDLAGAFSNDGFKLRDGHWTGLIELGKTRLIQVNLYAGNQYWFCVGATPEGKKMALSVYDETGKSVSVDAYSDLSKAAAGFAPQASGPYFVKVEELSGTPATFCLLYSYK